MAVPVRLPMRRCTKTKPLLQKDIEAGVLW
jgi:hypothetical protein